MNVIHLIHSLDNYSGAAKQALNLISYLEKSHNVNNYILTRQLNNNNNKKNVFYFKNRLPSRLINFFIMYFKIKPDIMHFHGSDFLLLVLCKIMRIKVYWKSTLFGSDDFHTLTTKTNFGFIKKQLIKLIDCNNSLTIQMYNVNKLFLDKNKIVTVPNGVFSPPYSIINKKENIAVIVSAIIPRKSIIEGIEFFNKHLRPLGYYLYIIGPYSESLDGFSNEYKELCFRMSDEKVHFLGEIEQKLVFELLMKARFLIHPSQNEGMPNVVLESFSYLTYPIVTSMNGLANEIITHNVNGFNIEYSDEFDIENFNIPNFEGQKLVQSKYSFEIVSKKTHQIYIDLINKK